MSYCGFAVVLLFLVVGWLVGWVGCGSWFHGLVFVLGLQHMQTWATGYADMGIGFAEHLQTWASGLQNMQTWVSGLQNMQTLATMISGRGVVDVGCADMGRGDA